MFKEKKKQYKFNIEKFEQNELENYNVVPIKQKMKTSSKNMVQRVPICNNNNGHPPRYKKTLNEFTDDQFLPYSRNKSTKLTFLIIRILLKNY